MEAYRRYGTSYQTNLFLVGPSRYPPFSAGTLELDKAISAQLDPLSLSKVTAERSQVLLLGDFGWFLQWAPPEHSDPQSKEQMEWHGRCDSYNMAFLDGHVQYVRLVKGYYVGYGYCVLPFEGLFSEALRCQGPAPALPDWDGVIDTEDFLRCIYRAGLPDRGPETPTPGVPSDWDNALASDHYGFSADGDVDVYDLGAREWLLDASSKKGTR
ncbi:MAG: hypothetical protein MUC88_16585 [Planctomycetes bacterium]|nr:hypothetical protein [Planctomycetota bacterium]